MLKISCKSILYSSIDEARLASEAYDKRMISDGTGLTENTCAFTRGEVTLIVGREGSGKSTLIQTLARGLAKKNLNCGFILTEETVSDYKLGIGSSITRSTVSSDIYAISLFEEAYLSGRNKKESDDVWNSVPKIMEDFIKEKNIDVLFFDNMTTNKTMLDYNLQDQTQLFLQMRSVAYANRCSVVLVFHTGKAVRSGVFQNADIEGSNAPAKTSPNILLHYNFMGLNSAVVKVNKVRQTGSRKHSTYHLLNYSNKSYQYAGVITRDEFDEIEKRASTSKKLKAPRDI